MGYRIECSVSIEASREVVWSAVQNFSRRTEWDARVIGAEMLTSLPQERGTHFRMTYRVLGIRSWVESEYIVWNPPERNAIRAVAFNRGTLLKSVAGSWLFHENGDGSTTWTTKVNLGMYGGPVAPVLERVAGWYFRRLTERSQLNAKRLIEGEKTSEGVVSSQVAAT